MLSVLFELTLRTPSRFWGWSGSSETLKTVDVKVSLGVSPDYSSRSLDLTGHQQEFIGGVTRNLWADSKLVELPVFLVLLWHAGWSAFEHNQASYEATFWIISSERLLYHLAGVVFSRSVSL